MSDGAPRGAAPYFGPDLVNAAERSTVDRSMRDRYAGFVNGFGILADTVCHRRRQGDNPHFELVIATGSISGTSSTAFVAYAGTGVNRDWCFGTTFSEYNIPKTLRTVLSHRETRVE